MEILEAGGGIQFTVRHTKDATESKLYADLIERLNDFLKSGEFNLLERF
jgi:imidazolonepropionase-like amidohydrolase